MAGIRFKTIFSRMLLQQWLGMVVLLLLSGGAIALVLQGEGISTEEQKLLSLSSQAAGAYPALKSGAKKSIEPLKDGAYCIQFVHRGEFSSYYEDPRWDAPVVNNRRQESIERLMLRASTVPDSTLTYIKGADFPVLTLFCTFENGGESLLLLAHKDVSHLKREQGSILAWIGILSLAAAGVAFISAYYAVNRIIRPFMDMNHAVQCYSKGDFSQRISVTGRDEASQLGRSFNEMAEQLKDLETTRRSFVANVSHELRSPLTSMKGFLEAILDGTIPPEEQEHYLSVVLSETLRMNAMVNDLLDLARIESGIITLNRENFDINELIRRTLITFEARISEKNIELQIRFSHDQCFVNGDVKQISQVLRNLIDNAIKYSPDSSILRISSYTMKKEAYISIKDNGIGIPAEDVPRVFDRFYKVEKAHTPAPQVGSGLGLAIVKRIIEAHGQSITVKSARGKGATFTFTLPQGGSSALGRNKQ